jgi:tetratricopeptide (TPR) repeat protein
MQRCVVRYLLFVVVLGITLAGLFCSPVSSQIVSVEVTSGPGAVHKVTAQEYEQQGMALMAEKNWSGLLALTGEGIAAYPQDAELFCLQGYAFRKLGRYADAVNSTTIGINLDHQPARYANRGYALLALDRNAEALSDADAAISLNASYTPAYGIESIALARMGNFTGAEAAVDTALSLDPTDPFLWQLKGEDLAGLGNCSGARSAFETSLAINADNHELPWPGFVNTTTDLQRLDSVCPTTQPTTAPNTTPTRAPVPLVAAVGALVLGAYFRKR